MDTRTINMQRRRDRILGEARRMLARSGYEALSTRALAEAAEVSAPTLYNLIGNKARILEALELEAAAVIEERLRLERGRTPLEIALAIVVESVAVFGEDEDYYRAAIVAAEQLAAKEPEATTRLDAKAVRLAQEVCLVLIELGVLRNHIAADELAQQLYACYSNWLRDWGARRISLEAFGRQTMRGFCLILAADAVDTFRAQLIQHFAELEHWLAEPRARTTGETE